MKVEEEIILHMKVETMSTSVYVQNINSSVLVYSIPLNTQNHRSSGEEQDFHPTMYFQVSNPGGKLAS